MKTITFRKVRYKILNGDTFGLVVEIPEKLRQGNHSRMQIPWGGLTLTHLRAIKNSDLVFHVDTNRAINNAITLKQNQTGPVRGSTTPREILHAALGPIKSNLTAKSPWRQQVKDMIREQKEMIRQDKKDLAWAKKHEEYDTAFRLQITIGENENFLDSLTFLRDNCD